MRPRPVPEPEETYRGRPEGRGDRPPKTFVPLTPYLENQSKELEGVLAARMLVATWYVRAVSQPGLAECTLLCLHWYPVLRSRTSQIRPLALGDFRPGR